MLDETWLVVGVGGILKESISQHTMTTRLDILALKSTVLTGTMCLHALLCVNIPLTNTRVKELEVKERI